MSHIRSFLLGVGAAYAVYYLTKKKRDGRSIIDDLLEDPHELVDQAKNELIAGVAANLR